jgi:hypothetical protein
LDQPECFILAMFDDVVTQMRCFYDSSGPILKFAPCFSEPSCECQNRRTTSKYKLLVEFLNLRFASGTHGQVVTNVKFTPLVLRASDFAVQRICCCKHGACRRVLADLMKRVLNISTCTQGR